MYIPLTKEEKRGRKKSFATESPATESFGGSLLVFVGHRSPLEVSQTLVRVI